MATQEDVEMKDSTVAVSNSFAPSPPPVLTRKFYEILPLQVVPVLPVFVLKLRHICGCCRSEDYWASSAPGTRELALLNYSRKFLNVTQIKGNLRGSN